MALPINIEELLSGRVVETERLEFKRVESAGCFAYHVRFRQRYQ